MDIFSLLVTQPMGYVIRFIYSFIPNYGLAIIIFTILIKLVLFPLSLKSQKSMAKQQKLQPVIAEIQKKYANDKEKLNKEIMDAYKQNGVNPAGGCLPLLLQFPILIGLYQVISKPLVYLMKLPNNIKDNAAVIENVTKIRDYLHHLYPSAKYAEMDAQKIFDSSQALLANHATAAGVPSYGINFNFLGLNLSHIPNEALSFITSGKILNNLPIIALLIIPVIAMVSTWYSSYIMQPKKEKKVITSTLDLDKKSNDPTAGMNQSMLLMMPIMTGFFTLTFSASLGIYWIISNFIQIGQFFLTKKLTEKENEEDVKHYLEEKNTGKKRKKR